MKKPKLLYYSNDTTNNTYQVPGTYTCLPSPKIGICTFTGRLCVCFLPIYSGHQVRWTYQPGSHRRKLTQDFLSTSSAARALIFLARSIQPFLSLVDREVELCVYYFQHAHFIPIVGVGKERRIGVGRSTPVAQLAPRNLLTRWDVSSIPANGIFLTKN